MFQSINKGFMFFNIVLGSLFMVLTFVDFDTVGEDAICNRCWPAGAFIGWSYILLGLTVLAAIAGAGISAVVNPKGIKGSLIGMGGMLVILVLSYVLASDEVMEGWTVTSTASKWSGVGLWMFYILFVLAILSIVYSAISRALK